uniref:phage tail protein n=1 Tax=Photorhabdus sp. RM322S TaxID=3342825 RepID=UPI0036DE7F9E
MNGKALTGDISLSAGDVGACRAYSGSISIGGEGTWTTDEFIVWLKQNGAFDVPYWMCKGSWSYASNRIINDTGCGNICLAGAVIEVMGVESAMTIRVTTPTTTNGNGIPNSQFTYINHGKDYRPGWRRDYTKDEVDSLIVPVGSPIPWPQPNPPSGYLACNGQAFNKSTYPQLAVAYPSGRLPDLRGEFIRGWDDGRGVDRGRVILSWQGGALEKHGHGYRDRYYIENMNSLYGANKKETTPAGYNGNVGSAGTDSDNNGFLYIDSTTSPTGGNETRPRNIAFNYIVRAA